MKPDPLKLIAYTTPEGAEICDTAKIMTFMALMSGCHVVTEFNHATLHAEPTSRPEDIVAEYDVTRDVYEKWICRKPENL
jgi:hypothetical protein